MAASRSHDRAAADNTPPPLIPHFPDPLSQEFIARLPLSYLPELARVSHSWRSHIHHPDLFNIRSNLCATEPFVCINVCNPTDQSRWYLLIRGHNRVPAHFIPLPPTPILTMDYACATNAGFRHEFPSNAVQIFDARRGTWTTAPRMAARRQFAFAGAIGGRMCIVGGHLPSLEPWAEAFDPESRKWSPVPRTPGLPGKKMLQCGPLGTSFLATDNGSLLFIPGDMTLNRPDWTVVKNYVGQKVMLDGLGYFIHLSGKSIQYDPTTNHYKVVEGVDLNKEMHPGLLESSKLTNLRGVLCLVWKDGQRINCIGIQVTWTSHGSVSGSIVWRE